MFKTIKNIIKNVKSKNDSGWELTINNCHKLGPNDKLCIIYDGSNQPEVLVLSSKPKSA